MGCLDKVISWGARSGIKLPVLLQAATATLSVLGLALLYLLYRLFGPLVPLMAVIIVGLLWFWIMLPAVIPKMYSDAKAPGAVRFVAISDTHNRHDQLSVPAGDVLLCAGDFTYKGTVKEITRFNSWLGTLPHKHKIVIAGNHDLLLDHKAYNRLWEKWVKTKEHAAPEVAKQLLTNATYLEHEEVVINGVRVFGSPYQPAIPRRTMAFNLSRGAESAAVWETVPAGIDVLCTHGPPYGRRDRIFLGGKRVGCRALAAAVQRTQPQYHVFGHIHESYGVEEGNGTTFINAACVNLRYKPQAQRPIVFDVTPRTGLATGT